jgi:monothiol glutaredoxin
MENLAAETQKRIETILSENHVILFMKGSADAPMCGFSAKAVAMLNHLGVDFTDIDILQDEEIRQGLKIYGDWPTFPQLYVNKELIGGADIMGEMFQSGELKNLLTLS